MDGARPMIEPLPWNVELRSMRRRVSGEVTTVAHIDDVFWQVQAIIAANPAINRTEVFYDWLGDTYVDSAVIRIRRLLDKQRSVISLWRLLEQVRAEHARFTRAWFNGLWSPDLQDVADQRFDMLAGRGARFIAAETVAPKQQELDSALQRVEDFANANIAHRVAATHTVTARFADLREALAAAFRVFNWCALLIEASSWTSAVPEIQTNWTAVFREPWLPAGAPLPQYKHLDEIERATR
jgi:hypothetical protein